MSAVASSRINKSGKKFVPKAPVRRAGPATVAAKPAPVSDDLDVIESLGPKHTASTESTELQTPRVVEPRGEQATYPIPPADAAVQGSGISEPTKEDAVAIPIPKNVSVPTPITVHHAARSSPIPAHTPSGVPVLATPITVVPSTRKYIEDDTSQGEPRSPPQKRKRGEQTNDATSGQIRRKRRKSLQDVNDEEDNPNTTFRTPGVEVLTAPRKGPKTSATSKKASHSPQPNTTQRESQNSKSTVKKTKSRKRQPKRTMEEAAANIVAEATGKNEGDPKAKRKRQATPEDADAHQITTSAVTMADLTEDSRLGKKSERETRLQNTDWEDVKRKRKLLEEARLSGPPKDVPLENAPPPVPQLAVVNGQLVAVEGSQYVDSGVIDETAPAAINEDDIVNRVNSGTLGRKKNHLGRNKWDEEMTHLFYRGLRMFGTDFSMISQMFPGMSRRHVKSKFVKEERQNPELIKQTLLGPREQADIAEISKMSNIVYGDVEEFEKILEADRKKEEEQHAKAEAEKLKQANLVTEDGDEHDMETMDGDMASKENKFGGIAEGIVSAATRGGRKGKRGRQMLKKNPGRNQGLAGGDAVILGPVNES
ncbi:putative transcription factor tfiiib component [Phaeomoniella chlamydospora]|uniref:Putative transcription factor tfiiib component n=1 Tax=Phaeomoniella chlamydospora TaxID=158046 RepID=A0A0G2FV23_PHACM|nr:putative transcription factor tfiiib component [Phaeomoniella chlamydospora]